MSDSQVLIQEPLPGDATARLDAESIVRLAVTYLRERIRLAGTVDGRYMDVNAASEGLVHDADALTQLVAILAKLVAGIAVTGTVALDAPTLAALETINAVVTGSVSVTNFPASVEVSNDVGNPLPVNGTVALDAATLAALETIGLDAATLAALETINAVVSGTVALDAASLAALETIQIGSLPAVALDAASLAALETIELGATTLAALENTTVTVGNPGLTETQLRTVLPDETGTWSYYAGVSGTVVVAAGERVIGIVAVANAGSASFAINGGASIPIPIPTSGVGSMELAPRAALVAPTIVFTSTVAYLVEVVS